MGVHRRVPQSYQISTMRDPNDFNVLEKKATLVNHEGDVVTLVPLTMEHSDIAM